MIALLTALVALVSSWFHPVAPAPIPEPPAVVAPYAADPVTPDPTTEAPAATTEAPEPSTEAPAATPEPDPTTESSTEAPEPAPAANWMEALQTTADPDGIANWHFYRNGAWGASDGYNIYIDPNSPEADHLSIVLHEMGHVMQARYYGSLDSARRVVDIESQADCIAQIRGANWLNYGCDPSLMESAQAVLKGK